MYSKQYNTTTVGFQGKRLASQDGVSPYLSGAEKDGEAFFLEGFGKIKICESMRDIVENSGFFTEESKSKFIFV